CSAGSLGSADDEGGGVKITVLQDGSEPFFSMVKATAEAFHAATPDTTVVQEALPGDGDNALKTRLSIGEAPELLLYLPGSLLQALNPEKNLVPLDDQPWASHLDETFAAAAKVNGKLYGGPWGTAYGGGVLYNK